MVLVGEVRENCSSQYPYIAVVTDDTGRLIATLPALSRVLGEMYVLEVFSALGAETEAKRAPRYDRCPLTIQVAL